MNGGSNLCQQKLITHTKKSEKESLDFQKQDPLSKQHFMGTTMYSGYMVYRYSADYGATWENGKVVSYKTESYLLDKIGRASCRERV